MWGRQAPGEDCHSGGPGLWWQHRRFISYSHNASTPAPVTWVPGLPSPCHSLALDQWWSQGGMDTGATDTYSGGTSDFCGYTEGLTFSSNPLLWGRAHTQGKGIWLNPHPRASTPTREQTLSLTGWQSGRATGSPVSHTAQAIDPTSTTIPNKETAARTPGGKTWYPHQPAPAAMSLHRDAPT